ncbi:hypothetical protein FDUTEX481_00619 [Tolypothrix sp. PCC 7601]|nr:hypothetical protein FDUTEX481_00619 [Tolypothrix sp. PCC 7601]
MRTATNNVTQVECTRNKIKFMADVVNRFDRIVNLEFLLVMWNYI